MNKLESCTEDLRVILGDIKSTNEIDKTAVVKVLNELIESLNSQCLTDDNI